MARGYSDTGALGKSPSEARRATVSPSFRRGWPGGPGVERLADPYEPNRRTPLEGHTLAAPPPVPLLKERETSNAVSPSFRRGWPRRGRGWGGSQSVRTNPSHSAGGPHPGGSAACPSPEGEGDPEPSSPPPSGGGGRIADGGGAARRPCDPNRRTPLEGHTLAAAPPVPLLKERETLNPRLPLLQEGVAAERTGVGRLAGRAIRTVALRWRATPWRLRRLSLS